MVLHQENLSEVSLSVSWREVTSCSSNADKRIGGSEEDQEWQAMSKTTR
jgi:hypothetical protein